MEEIRVNALAKVRNSDIRHITHNNRAHIVVPSWTLPDNCVMNGGLYPAEEIEAGFKTLEGTLAPIGHPTVNGKHVLANTPEAINAHYHGVWNKNVAQEGGRIYVEKWIDVEVAARSDEGKALLDAIDKGEPIHTSTGLVCNRELAVNQAAYTWVARDMRFDHDAILFGEPGAATPDDGVGMMVNSAELVVNAVCPELVVNGVLSNSYGQKRDALQAAIRELFATAGTYAYVEDFDDSKVVYGIQGKYYSVGYEFDGSAPVIEGSPEELVSRVEYIAKGAVVGTQFALNKNSVQCVLDKPIIEQEPETMDETKLAAALALAVNAAVKPLADDLATLRQENAALAGKLDESLTANARQTDEENRAVILAKAPNLKLVVNTLKGEPLAELAAQYQDAAPIVNGRTQPTGKDNTMSEFDDYKGA
jgi:hypothetical protein